MSDAELRDQLMTLLMAGHETTATGARLGVRPAVRAPRQLERLRDELAEGGHEYLDAVIEETLRMRPVVPVRRSRAARRRRAGGLRASRGHGGDARDLPRPHPPGLYPRPLRVPARAVPRRRRPGDLQLDPVRRRHPPLHRRRLRPARDAGRPARRAGAGGAAPGDRTARADRAPQRHPVAAQRDPGDPGRAAARPVRAA